MYEKKSATESILDWFERNPTAKARSGPLAKALKMDATRCADALARLAQPGNPLMRVKVEVGAKVRAPGAAKEQWEYWLAIGGKAPEPVKPYKAPPTYRREPNPRGLAQAEKNSPTFAKTESPAPQAIPAEADETGARDKKIVKVALTANVGDTAIIKATIEQLEGQLREAQIAAAEWQKKYETAIEGRAAEQHEASMQLADAAKRNQQLEEALQASGKVSSTQEARHPSGYVVARPKKPLRRFSKLHSAQTIALSAVRAGDRAEVFAIYHVGKAIPCAEWRTC